MNYESVAILISFLILSSLSYHKKTYLISFIGLFFIEALYLYLLFREEVLNLEKIITVCISLAVLNILSSLKWNLGILLRNILFFLNGSYLFLIYYGVLFGGYYILIPIFFCLSIFLILLIEKKIQEAALIICFIIPAIWSFAPPAMGIYFYTQISISIASLSIFITTLFLKNIRPKKDFRKIILFFLPLLAFSSQVVPIISSL